MTRTAFPILSSRLCKGVLGLVGAWTLAGALSVYFYPPSLLSDEIVVLPEMVGQRAAWESRDSILLVLLGAATISFLGTFLFFRGRLFFALGATLLCLFGLLGGLGQLSDNVRESQSCANCRSFIAQFLTTYAQAQDGWLPRGGRDALDSLAKVITDESEVHFFTSHAQTAVARSYWLRTRSLSADVCCYRYNEGLRIGDPAGLIVLYYESPGLWECNHHPTTQMGRACLLHPGRYMEFDQWEFLPEKEFQALQAKTTAHIANRNWDEAQVEAIRKAVSLEVDYEQQDSGVYRFAARIRNLTNEALSVYFLKAASVEFHGCSLTSELCSRLEEVSLAANSTHGFHWMCKLEVRGPEGRRSHRAEVRCQDLRAYAPSPWMLVEFASTEELRQKCFAEALAYARVTRADGKEVDLTLRSPQAHFLKEP
jgi:hypothetical protein